MTLLGYLKGKVMPNGCEVSTTTVKGRRFHMERCIPGDGRSAEYSVYRRKTDPTVARLSVFFGEDYSRVRTINVASSLRRSGLGTRLYEYALKESCQRNLPLESDASRSAFAEAFWRKQKEKGRAICVPNTRNERSDVYLVSTDVAERSGLPVPVERNGDLEWPCLYYQVTEPCKTKSLAGLKTKKRSK